MSYSLLIPIKFDYNNFYNYLVDNQQKIYYYFTGSSNPTYNPQYRKSANLPNNYISINNTKIYFKISNQATKTILFIIPKLYNNDLYGDHYTFGIEKLDQVTILTNPPKQKNMDTIFFHKTIQIPETNNTGYKVQTRCHFRNMSDIISVSDIICTNEKDSYMIDKFPFEKKFPLQDPKDIEYITELICRPFIGIINQGGKIIYKGKKGGLYFLSKNRKKYLKNIKILHK